MEALRAREEIGEGQRYVDSNPGSFGRYMMEQTEEAAQARKSDTEMRERLRALEGMGMLPADIGVRSVLYAERMPDGKYCIGTPGKVHIREAGNNGAPSWITFDLGHIRRGYEI
jgi:hypothetical protein